MKCPHCKARNPLWIPVQWVVPPDKRRKEWMTTVFGMFFYRPETHAVRSGGDAFWICSKCDEAIR